MVTTTSGRKLYVQPFECNRLPRLTILIYAESQMRKLWAGGPHEYVHRPLTDTFAEILLETNRKCPRWAEFNTEGGPISATSPPAATANSPPPTGASAMSPPSSSTLGVGRDTFFGAGPAFRQPSFNYPAVPSPLATSPPATANEWPEEDGGSVAPKKIMLKMKK